MARRGEWRRMKENEGEEERRTKRMGTDCNSDVVAVPDVPPQNWWAISPFQVKPKLRPTQHFLFLSWDNKRYCNEKGQNRFFYWFLAKCTLNDIGAFSVENRTELNRQLNGNRMKIKYMQFDFVLFKLKSLSFAIRFSLRN